MTPQQSAALATLHDDMTHARRERDSYRKALERIMFEVESAGDSGWKTTVRRVKYIASVALGKEPR